MPGGGAFLPSIKPATTLPPPAVRIMMAPAPSIAGPGMDEGLELLDLERGHVRVFVLHKYSRSLSLELRLRFFLGQSRGKRRRRRRPARVV